MFISLFRFRVAITTKEQHITFRKTRQSPKA